MQQRTFVGFGFGPIQAGLFLLESHLSGTFDRYVVAEVDGRTVAAVRGNDGRYCVNVARTKGIDSVTIPDIEIYNPLQADDRSALVAAVAEAREMATCLPSVALFDEQGEAGAARLIAEGLACREDDSPVLIYAAENHNQAAELLSDRIASFAGGPLPGHVQVINTVIGKMSGLITDADQRREQALEAVTPDSSGAFLVEEFNRILVSRVNLPGFRRGIAAFEEKDDLLPFEEAKLYGHNAIHALIGYLANLRGMATMAEAGADAEIMAIAREAFLNESGATLIKRHAGLSDTLFSPDGYRDYADDLLGRMVNPFLNDRVSRICRDPLRKLGYDDRFYGTMRLALEYGIEPKQLALGAAAAVLSETATPSDDTGRTRPVPNRDAMEALLLQIWDDPSDEYAPRLISLTADAMQSLVP